MSKAKYLHFDSALIHGAGISRDTANSAVNVPIYLSSTFKQTQPAVFDKWEYARSGNPTRAALESLIAELENGNAGFAFSSGMAALTAVATLLKAGDKVIIGTSVYGGTFRLLDQIFSRFGIAYIQINTSDLAAFEQAAQGEDVKAVFVESPSNPLLSICDLKAIAQISARNSLLSVADNTFMTPYLQKPLDLGFDLVVHSATKYLGGHSDLLAGLIVARDKELADKLSYIQNATGAVLSPFDSFLLIRGMKTLALRMDRHVENAEKVASFLAQNDKVSAIYYPGLKTFAGYELNLQQAKNGGAMLSFELKKSANMQNLFANLQMIMLAESLGGVESLICYPAKMTHAAMPEHIRLENGISNELIRLSVGVENSQDIINDLSYAINAAFY